MKNLTLLIFLFPVAVIAAKLKCPDGQFFVKSHFRKAYTKSDGTAVSATTVRPYCKLLSKGAEYLQKKFKSGLPTNWPHKSEKPAAWTEHEKQRLIEIIDELPDAMLIKDLDGIYRAS